MSELAVVPADFVRPFPSRVSFAQASMLGTTYGTAHYALKYEARLQRGEVCLVHAAAGALGLSAQAEARVVGLTCGSRPTRGSGAACSSGWRPTTRYARAAGKVS